MAREQTAEAQRLLAASVDVILERGVATLSLSQLARAVGSNNRMLLYYFGSKDRLFTEAIRAAYERFPDLAGLIPSLHAPGDIGDLICAGWRRLRAPANLPYLLLFFEAYAAAVRAPDENRAHLAVLATHWPDGIRSAFTAHGWSPSAAHRASVQVLALWRGLQLDLVAGADAAELDAAHDEAVRALLAAQRPPAS